MASSSLGADAKVGPAEGRSQLADVQTNPVTGWPQWTGGAVSTEHLSVACGRSEDPVVASQ